MKKLLMLLFKIFTVILIQAQVPGEINYQGVARNPGGIALANQNITLRISIRNNSATGNVVYQETRKLKTNGFGLFTVAIGSAGALNTSGSIAGVNWSDGDRKYVQVEIDPSAGYSFRNMGAAQLLSVPYALYAETASPKGAAGGSLKGNYPNPGFADASVTTTVIRDSSVTNTKLADGSVSSAKIEDSAVTTVKIKDASVTANKLSDNAVTTNKLSDNAVTTDKLSDNAVTTNKLTDNSVTTAKISDNSVTTAKISDNSVSTEKIQDASITFAKLAPGVAAGGSQPTGPAGGDLNGSYPNPSIAPQTITQNKIANGAVTTNKIDDGAVTAIKIASGVIPASLPPSGAAGGDLSGTYPNPSVGKLQGVSINNTAPASGQVLKYDGTKWTPSVDNTGTFTLPYNNSFNSASSLFSVTNQGTGISLEGINSSTTANVNAVYGKITAATPGANASGIRGSVSSTGAEGFGVWGSHAGTGAGVYGTTVNGSGISGKATGGNGVAGISTNGVGVFGSSDNGLPGLFNISNANNFNDALFASNSGFGNGIVALSTYSNGVLGIANDVAGAGVFGINNAGGEGVVGRGFSDFAAAVVGRNDGSYAGVRAVSAATNGTALLAQANVDGTSNGTAITAELEGSNAGNIAVFKANGVNVARIDHTGKAFFNNSTQVGGADVAEYFAVEGNRMSYEPGDVLVISLNTDRTIEKSSKQYSNLVSGVYATKAGLLLTEENAEKDDLAHMIPMGVIGVIPVKVCLEGGEINRGDMLVTSSTPGVAMKGDIDKIKVGQVLGKALQDFNHSNIGKINVLVSVK